jgi:hypothetical protein
MDESETMIAARLRSALVALKRVAEMRHHLAVGTPEYQAAVETELRLVEEVRRLTDQQRVEDE